MAQPTPTIRFEDIPLDKGRRTGRGSRIDPELYNTLKGKIQSLDNTATRLTIPEGIRPTTMKKSHPPHSHTAQPTCERQMSPRRPPLLALHR